MNNIYHEDTNQGSLAGGIQSESFRGRQIFEYLAYYKHCSMEMGY